MAALITPRLRLRNWRPEDRPAFAELNANPHVMEFLPKVLSREESDAMADRIETHFAQNGFGLWAVEVPGMADFIGFVGLSVPRFEAAFTPCVEVGWRLASAHWGKGYATEAARAAVGYGFGTLGLREIVSFTVPANVASRAVMERLGMRRDPAEDFDHPAFAEGHRLRRHVLYRLAAPAASKSREGWLSEPSVEFLTGYGAAKPIEGTARRAIPRLITSTAARAASGFSFVTPSGSSAAHPPHH